MTHHRKTITLAVKAWILFIAFFLVLIASANDQNPLQNIYGDNEMVELATGFVMPVPQLPAAATVVDRRDIENIGVRTLAEVLDTAPGIQVVSGRGRTRLLNIRGIFDDIGPDVLIKRDNVPITQGAFNSFNPLDLMPVNNIERIEIIRGPNSAIDGASALSGSINIITRSSTNYRGTEIGSRIGDHDTYDAWINHGTKIGPLEVGVGLSAWTTDGPRRTLENDTQSQSDIIFGTTTSFAPDTLNFANHGLDLQLDINMGPWHAQLWHYDVESYLGAGVAHVIDPNANADIEYTMASVNYSDFISNELEAFGLFSFIDRKNYFEEQFLQPGLPQAPNGIIGDLENNTRLFRAEGSIVWSGLEHHKVRLGMGAYITDNYEINQTSNTRVVELPNGTTVIVPINQRRKHVGDEIALPETSEQVYYGSILDEWKFANDWILTTGLRIDSFSEVEQTVVTPRVSLIWRAAPNRTLKLLYGQGFRPPTFVERRTRPNQGFAEGNPDLDPEKINSVEFGINQWGDNYQFDMALYGYRISDKITVTAKEDNLNQILIFENEGHDTGYGFEINGVYSPFDNFRLKSNYSFHDKTKQPTSSIGGAAKHLLFAEATWEIWPQAFIDINLRGVFDRDRATSDPRSPVDDYVTLNLSVRKKTVYGIDLALTVRNILDTDARDPSTDNDLSTVLPLADTPLPDRAFWGEIRIAY